jgi:histidine ammonia-lyase
MGNASGLTCWQVLANSECAVAIELLAAAQGVEFLAPLEPGAGCRAAHRAVRALSDAVTEDRSISADIERVAEAIRTGAIGAAVEAEIGALA